MIIVVSINTPTLPTSFIAIMISIIIIIQIDNNEDGDDERGKRREIFGKGKYIYG